MGDLDEQTFILSSRAKWCTARFVLDTREPLGDVYRIHCPACKTQHEFSVLLE